MFDVGNNKYKQTNKHSDKQKIFPSAQYAIHNVYLICIMFVYLICNAPFFCMRLFYCC